MTHEATEPGWIPVEDYVADTEIRASELVSLIIDGHLPGGRFGGRWFLEPPVVALVPPIDASGDTAKLIMSVCRMGSYLTAGSSGLPISLGLDDPGARGSLDALLEAMRHDPTLPVEIELTGRRFCVDSSLWLELSAALVELDILQNGVPES
jgi:hypothetical protein